MQKKIDKTDIEFQLFQKWWKFRQEYYEPKTDEEFETLVYAVDEFVKQFKGTEVERLARSMALLHAEDCELRWKNESKRVNRRT